MQKSFNKFNVMVHITKIVTIILLSTSILLTTACDKNKQLRQQTEQQLTQQQSELYSLQEQMSEIDTEISAQKREIATQQRTADDLRQQKATKQAELTQYLNEHKGAVVALGATVAGGLVAFDKETQNNIGENFDEETSQEIQAVGAVTAVGGIAYCLFNADECSNVTATIASYETATKEIDDNLTRADETIVTLNTDIERLTEKQNELQQSIDNMEENINYTQQKIEELRPIGLAKILNNL